MELVAVRGNNTFEAATEPVVNSNTVVEESNKVSKSNNAVVEAPSEQKRLSVEEIEKKALAFVSGDGAVVTDFEFESEGKWSHYEVEVITKEAEYELKLDAITGELLHKEVDRHDDDDDYYDEVYGDDLFPYKIRLGQD